MLIVIRLPHKFAKLMISPSSTKIVTVSICLCLITMHAVVEVGLVPLNRSVSENETFQVCAQLTAGQLGCNITVPLDVATEDNSTIGKTVPSLTRFSKIIIDFIIAIIVLK